MYFEHTSVFPMRKSKFYSWLESKWYLQIVGVGTSFIQLIFGRESFSLHPIWKAESAKLWVRVFMTLTEEVIILRFSTWKWFILVACWGKWGSFVLFFQGRLHYLMTIMDTFLFNCSQFWSHHLCFQCDQDCVCVHAVTQSDSFQSPGL